MGATEKNQEWDPKQSGPILAGHGMYFEGDPFFAKGVENVERVRECEIDLDVVTQLQNRTQD